MLRLLLGFLFSFISNHPLRLIVSVEKYSVNNWVWARKIYAAAVKSEMLEA
jgi:hypothetical protein